MFLCYSTPTPLPRNYASSFANFSKACNKSSLKSSQLSIACAPSHL